MQDLLFDSGHLEKDVVYTPDWCARDMVQHFKPCGKVLEPSKGEGALLKYLPAADWCEIREGRDFFRCFERYDWIIGNPPYAGIPDWCRHSFALADDVVYLIPCRSVYLGPQFIRDVYAWGGIVETRHYGGGGQLGFPFGNAVAAFHFRKGWRGDMKVTHHGMPDEGAGLSWDGFNVRGDAQSVREVRRLVEFHAARSPERPNVGSNRPWPQQEQ